MNKPVCLILILLSLCFSVYSQETILLWDEQNPPTENGLDDEAELIVYLPEIRQSDKTSVPAVLICPGGGYAGVSMPYEGHAFARWMASQGFVSAILKYRLPNKHKEIPFDDVGKAMSVINRNAENWNIDVNRVGIAGFSAGGHLASVFSNLDSEFRPAFTILFYPVISFENLTKGGTRPNLLGDNPSASDILKYSANLQVTNQTSSAIIFMADDDPSVPSIHSTLYYDALKKHNIPASLYIFPEGGHGWGLLDSFKYNEQCLDLLRLWLDKNVLKAKE